MASMKTILLSKWTRRLCWVAVLVIPIAMTRPWSDGGTISFVLGCALGLAIGGLLVSLTAAYEARSVGRPAGSVD
jgi:hypothetical protein